MLGHTETKTINARRPLTDNMRAVLGTLVRIGRIYHSHMDQSEANAMRALVARGYAEWHIEWRSYSATLAGRAALTNGVRNDGA
jgi:hypothetical protein